MSVSLRICVWISILSSGYVAEECQPEDFILFACRFFEGMFNGYCQNARESRASRLANQADTDMEATTAITTTTLASTTKSQETELTTPKTTTTTELTTPEATTTELTTPEETTTERTTPEETTTELTTPETTTTELTTPETATMTELTTPEATTTTELTTPEPPVLCCGNRCPPNGTCYDGGCDCLSSFDEDHCGVIVITSPNYPDDQYRNNFDYTCSVTGRPGQNINVNFDTAFEVDVDEDCGEDEQQLTGDNCRYDHLVLQGVKYCGSAPPDPIIIPVGESLTVQFITDYWFTCNGFKLNITYTDV